MIYIQNKKTPNKDKPLALFHINACSLHKNSDYLQHLSCSNKKFDQNFSFEFTPNESSAGGSLLYIANHLSYKSCLDLNI